MENPSIVLQGVERIEVEGSAIPKPSSGEVVVKTIRSLISGGTEMTLYEGKAENPEWANLTTYPRFMGYSNVGEVVEVGEGVDPCWIGRRVHSHGAHRAYTTAPAHSMRELPDSVLDEHGCFTTLAKVAMNGLRRGQVTWGESVGIFGLGIIGQLAARLCLIVGARPVFVIEPSEFRRSLLPDDARMQVLSGAQEDLSAYIQQHNQGRKLDVVLEITGNPEVIPSEPLLLREQGRFVMVSSPRGASLFDFHDLCNRHSLTIIGSHGFSHPQPGWNGAPWTSGRHGELFLSLLATGEVDVGPLVSRRFSYRDATDAYAYLSANRADTLGIILEW